jgi:hypothetical protein
MVLLIVGITVPRLIVERESWGRSSEGGIRIRSAKIGALGGLRRRDEEERERCLRLKARNEMQTSQCYKSLWLRWAEKGQTGTHGKL